MKGLQALAIAAALGVGGAMFNFAYLRAKSQGAEQVYFVGIARKDASGREVVVDAGDPLKKEYLVRVGIPEDAVGKLADFAVPYSAINSVVDRPVWRPLVGGSLLLEDDLKTPPPEDLDLGEGESARWVPIDTRQAVVALLKKNDMVSFIVPRSAAGFTPPAVGAGTPGEAAGGAEEAVDAADGNPSSPDLLSPTPEPTPARRGATELIGPFRVVSVGSRLGSADVTRAARMRVVQENTLGIAVKLVGGEFDAKAQKLADILEATNYRPLGVVLAPKEATKK